MRRLAALLALGLLAACGADGEPEGYDDRPGDAGGTITVGGSARIGVIGGL